MFRRRDLLQKISQQFDAEENAHQSNARYDDSQGDLMAYGNQYVEGAQPDVPAEETISRSQIVTPQSKPSAPMTLADHFARQASSPAQAQEQESRHEPVSDAQQHVTSCSAPAHPTPMQEQPKSTIQPQQTQQHMSKPATPVSAPSVPSPTNENIQQPSSGSAKNMLTVGPETILKGEINTCDRVVIEGKVEAIMKEVRVLEIGPGGRFQGNATVESAEIDGDFEGELHVTGKLVIRASGKVSGTVTYDEIEIMKGGKLAGNIGTQASEEMRPKLAAV